VCWFSVPPPSRWTGTRAKKADLTPRTARGARWAFFLPRGTVVRGGDVLVAEDGSLIQVQAANQAVLHIAACPEHGSPFDLMRAAYHLGNRHVPIELQPDHLKIEPDHVLAELMNAMHMIVTDMQAPFEPEGGAYGDNAMMGHAHGHSHGPSHDHAHTQGHAHDHPHSHDHDGADCGHPH